MTHSAPRPLRRSQLYVPGHRPEMVEAARGSRADVVCLCLEDNVPPEAKAVARDIVAEALAARGFRALELIVRVNGTGSAHLPDDLAMLAEARPDGVMLPKVASAAEVAALRATLPGVPVWAMIETAQGILNAPAIAVAPAVTALVIGSADLAGSLGIPARDAAEGLRLHGAAIVVAARAAGISVLDGITLPASDRNPLGFDGRSCYPGQDIDAVNAVFSPTAEEVAAARTALERPYAYGDHLAAAARLIARAEEIARRDTDGQIAM